MMTTGNKIIKKENINSERVNLCSATQKGRESQSREKSFH